MAQWAPHDGAAMGGRIVGAECGASSEEHGGGRFGGKQAAGCAVDGIGEALQRHAEDMGGRQEFYAGDEGSGISGYARSGAEAVWRAGERDQERDCQTE